MWFWRQQKNRRMGRVHVLDVKMRSSKIRAARTRLAAISLSVFFGCVLGVYLLWCGGQWALDRLVYENPSFAIQDIDIQTDGVISTDQLRRWSGVRQGANLLALDLASVKRDLELVPMIQSASVERVLPKTLRIRVTERQPVAQVNIPRPGASGGIEVVVFRMDADGYVMLPLDPRQRAVPLEAADDRFPILSGIPGSDLEPGRRVDLPRVQASLRLLAAFNQSSMASLVDLKRIDVSSADVLVVTTDQGSEVTFGLNNFPRQLLRWRQIHDMGLKMNKVVATLDLAVANYIPARWMDASSLPPGPIKNSNPSRRKKNV